MTCTRIKKKVALLKLLDTTNKYPTLMAYTGCALDFLVAKRVFGGAGL